MGKFGPRRTILDVPGNSAHKLRRGLDSAADALMVDLEDSVPPDDATKKEARHTVAAALTGVERDILLRTNEVVSPWFADDAALAVSLNLPGIILPKSTSIEQIATAQARLDELGAPADFEMWAIVETASFLLAVERTATLPSRLSTLLCGLVDLTFDLTPSIFLEPEGLDAAAVRDRSTQLRLRILVAARAAGLDAVDAITVQSIKDEALAESMSAAARNAGFSGVIVLHPAQIAAAGRGMVPSTAQLDTARRFVEAGDLAAKEQKMSAIVGGSVVLPQHVKSARLVLEAAEVSTAR